MGVRGFRALGRAGRGALADVVELLRAQGAAGVSGFDGLTLLVKAGAGLGRDGAVVELLRGGLLRRG